MAYKKQNKFNNKLTFDDGRLTIYSKVNTAEPGMKPIYKLKYKTGAFFRFEDIGITRYYEAKRANDNIDDLVTIWQDRSVRSTDIVKMETGELYEVGQVQNTVDDKGLNITKLTLHAFHEKLAVMEDYDTVCRVGIGMVGINTVGSNENANY